MEAKRPPEKSTVPPVMDVLPPKLPDPKVENAVPAVILKNDTPRAEHPAPVHLPPPKLSESPLREPRASGTTLAIVATIIIALGLGALLVYAYLRSNGISPY